MPGTPVEIGPWKGGMKNVPGFGEFIEDDQAYLLQNFEVDVDGSLTNRPAIRRALLTGPSLTTDDLRLIGTWITPNQLYLIVAASVLGVHLINPATSAVVATRAMIKPKACVSFNGTLYIVPQADGQGGIWTVAGTTYQWQAVTQIPRGETAVVYKDRFYIGQHNESKIVYSEINDFSNFPAVNNAGIGWDNKQPLKAMLVVGSDIFLWKSNSTYRYGHAGDPAKAEIKQIDNYVGTTDETTVALYNNNTIYTLSDSAVYELYQNTYTKISDDLDMTPKIDLSFFSNFGVSVFQERLFVRYYSKMYVLSLQTQRWSEWTSARFFAIVVTLPAATPGTTTGYAASIKATFTNKFLYYIQESRITGVADNPNGDNDKEGFTCKIITKSFDFQTPTYYKTILMGGLSVACSSPVSISAVVPGSQVIDGLSWGEAYAQYTWGSAYSLGLTWGTDVTSDGDVLMKTVIPPTDGAAFGRKLLKCLGKFRYRQVQFVIEIPASTNSRASFSVRLFNLTVYALQRETVVASVTP